MTRRAQANEIIRAALTPTPATRREAEFILREVYPWGERAGHPYKAWCLARDDVLAEIYCSKRVMVRGKAVCTGLFAPASRGQEGE